MNSRPFRALSRMLETRWGYLILLTAMMIVMITAVWAINQRAIRELHKVEETDFAVLRLALINDCERDNATLRGPIHKFVDAGRPGPQQKYMLSDDVIEILDDVIVLNCQALIPTIEALREKAEIGQHGN